MALIVSVFLLFCLSFLPFLIFLAVLLTIPAPLILMRNITDIYLHFLAITFPGIDLYVLLVSRVQRNFVTKHNKSPPPCFHSCFPLLFPSLAISLRQPHSLLYIFLGVVYLNGLSVAVR